MGVIFKWALACFFLFLYQTGYNQCLNSRPITTTSGDTVVYLCPDGKKTDVSVKQFTYGMPFATVVTTAQNIALKVVTSSVIDLAFLPVGEYRLYSYSYKGFLNDVVGRNVLTNPVTSYCYTQSSNFIKVIKTPPAAPVIDAQSLNPLFFCGPDKKFDTLKVNAQFPTGNAKAYLVVNELNKIVLVSNSALINADPLECKVCKVYAAGYAGKLIAKKGDDLNMPIADDCYSVSKNFITLYHDLPAGGTITLNGDASNQFICADSKKDQFLSMTISNNKGGLIKYVITDSLGTILEIKNDPILSSSSLQSGICKVFGLTYTGKLSQNAAGKNISNTVLSDDCYAITGNAITIVKKKPYAGDLVMRTSNNKFCQSDSIAELNIQKNNVVSGKQIWVITNESGIVEELVDAKLIPGRWSRGEKRIYNLSFTGALLLKAGSKITDQATDDCYDLSKIFIPILVDNPYPGKLMFSDSSSHLFVCAADTPALNIQFLQTAHNRFNQLFILTNEVGTILSTMDSTKTNLSKQNNGHYRIYAVSYIDNLNYTIGDRLTSIRSDKCLSVGSSFLSITKGDAKAGIVEFENAGDTLLDCMDSEHSKFKLKNKSVSIGKIQYIITNDNDTVISIQSDSIDLKNLSSGIYKIRPLAYTDTFSLLTGKPLSSLIYLSGCIDVSSKPLVVIKDLAEAGNIFVNDTGTSYQICAKDGWPDILRITNTSNSKFRYVYVLTDTSNTILSLQANTLNLELLPIYNVRLYGVSYNGNIQARIGDALIAQSFASGCVSISKSFIPITGTEMMAGTIRTNTNLTQLFYCIDSKMVDTIRLANNRSSINTSYVYIGIQQDTIRFVSETGILLSTELPAGITQIFGIAYKGNFLGKPGHQVSSRRLVDSCYGVSTNSITVNKDLPQAGTISAGNQSPIFLCPSDGQSDHINFTNVGSSALSYAYLIVNESDTIIDLHTNSLIDFDSYPHGKCTVYGISYKGNLQVLKKSIRATDLSDECFDITQQGITIIKSAAKAGKILLANGDTAAQFCVEDLGKDTLGFTSSAAVSLHYALLVTNTQDRIIYVLDDLNKKYDFNGYDPGQYRVYGLTYGGLLTAARNDLVKTSVLASGCFDLTDNFILLNLSNTGGLCKNIGVNTENTAFVSVYPNPVQGMLKIRIKPSLLKSGRPEMVLVSASGGSERKIILDRQVTVNQEIEIDVHALTPGAYFLLFKNGYIFDRIKVMILR